ncbi:MAG: translocation/assembly module TamB domain-containing protein [Nibricoccus sp.]
MRRLLKILGWVIAGLLLLAVTLPFWLGGLLTIARGPLGLSYGRYERIDYSRFVLRDVRYQKDNVSVTADRIEVATPLLYLWRHYRGGQSSVIVNDWRVAVESSSSPQEPSDPDAGWMDLRKLLLKIMDAVHRWLPEAQFKNGEVTFPGGRIGVGTGDWRVHVLQVDDLVWRGLSCRGTAGFFSADGLIRLQLADAKNALQVDLESRGSNVTGVAHWAEQKVSISSRFAERGWLPQEARAVAENWTVDGAKLGLGTVYTAVRGGGRIEWRKEHFSVDLTAKAEPLVGDKIPPLELTARGEGNLDTLTLEALHASIPGFQADLSEPVRVSRDGELLSGPSRFNLEADLGQQPWLAAAGRIKGEAKIEAGREFKPRVAMQFSAKDLKISQWAVPQLEIGGVLEWPLFKIDKASINLGGDQTIQLSGGTNLETRELTESILEARVNGTTVATWWPRVPIFSDAKVKAKFKGPWLRLGHEGSAQIVGLNQPPLRPLAMKLDWKGAGDAIDRLEIVAAGGEATFSLSGAVDRTGARIEELRIQKTETTWLALEKPARFEWLPVLRCEPLILAGDAGRVELAARVGVEGEGKLRVDDFSTKWLRDWLVWHGPDWRVPLVDFVGRWNNGPMEFSLSARADTDLAGQKPVELQLKALGDRNGVKIETLHAFEGKQEAIVASGAVPLIVTPASSSLWNFDPNAPLNFIAATQPDATFWTYLAATTGLVIERPLLNLELSGNWKSPRGKIFLRLPRLEANEERFKRKLPVAEEIDGVAELDRGEIALSNFSALIAGQQVRVEGRLALPKGGLSALVNAPWKNLVRTATGRVQMKGADLAAFAPYTSDVLAPKGRLDVDIALAGGKADGFIRVENAGTRPLGPLGVLQDLNADMAFVDRRMEIRSFRVRMANQLVELKGSAELGGDGVPRYDFSLKGEHLPFVRQVGLLLRGDLDLKLTSLDGGVGKVTGQVTMRESLFSTDVRDLMPRGGGAGAAARPPFFSIEKPPFNAWQLDVNLNGDRFLRLRTPVFNGVASMHFHLGNSLGEPRATGQATIDQGQVLLPFATFAIQQGSVQLTEANPYEPKLFVTGASRRYGYDLRMELSGTASTPILKFSSSPPLNSEQVLLLVMAGETPNSEITYSSNQRAVRFGAFLGKSLFSSMTTDSNGMDRLTISAGEKISRQGRETYEVEYWLGERWSLVGEYDEFDDYNAGLKWRALRDKPKEKNADAK